MVFMSFSCQSDLPASSEGERAAPQRLLLAVREVCSVLVERQERAPFFQHCLLPAMPVGIPLLLGGDWNCMAEDLDLVGGQPGTYENLLFTQVCSVPEAMHCSAGFGKMQSPLFSAALIHRLTATTVSLQPHL